MKRMIAVVAVTGLVLLAAVPADARGRGGGSGGGGGGSQGSSQGVRSGGGHHHGGHHHRGHGHRFHGHRFRSSFVVGTGVWVGPYWGPYWGGPYWGSPYWYPPYGAYPPAYAPVVIESQPQTYIQQQAPASSYWYYCEDARAYYPYVKECPAGWLTVVPHATPETQQ
jgi:hypothetical protein